MERPANDNAPEGAENSQPAITGSDSGANTARPALPPKFLPRVEPAFRIRVALGQLEEAMSGNKGFIALAITTALGILGTASVAGSDRERGRDSCVVPCSLDGVNPVYHPRIFGNSSFAKDHYGFVQGPDHTWHVIPNCRKPAFIGPCGGQ
jgi:hypothetical protein